MFVASLYIVVCGVKNRVRKRLRRLREPRYLLGAIAGAAYLYFAIFARMRTGNVSGARRRGSGAPPAEVMAVLSGRRADRARRGPAGDRGRGVAAAVRQRPAGLLAGRGRVPVPRARLTAAAARAPAAAIAGRPARRLCRAGDLLSLWVAAQSPPLGAGDVGAPGDGQGLLHRRHAGACAAVAEGRMVRADGARAGLRDDRGRSHRGARPGSRVSGGPDCGAARRVDAHRRGDRRWPSALAAVAVRRAGAAALHHRAAAVCGGPRGGARGARGGDRLGARERRGVPGRRRRHGRERASSPVRRGRRVTGRAGSGGPSRSRDAPKARSSGRASSSRSARSIGGGCCGSPSCSPR